jgi:ribonuclease HI
LEAREKEIKEVSLDPGNPEIKVLVGTNIPQDIEQQLLTFLKNKSSTFAWKHEDMTGISKNIITHKLGIDNSFRPIHQKRRKFAPERNVIIQEEVKKLLKAGMIREVQYPKWLANVVVVQKKNGKWRVCVDFTDLNKACPKDPFPLPHIDSMVDATAGHEMLTFMDASSGFQQIQMEPSDQEDTAFMTPTGIYCYIAMPFGLRNAGATYQRLVNMMFKDQLGDTMEVYIDDMVVKSKKAETHLQDLATAFSILDQYNMKLNPSKCHFGVEAGKFLGYMVTKRGIEASPEQIQAILNLKSPKTVKEVQRLTGRVAALNRFISRSSEKCKEFYDILRKNKKFEWTSTQEQALESLKNYLSSAPLLMKPISGEPLSLYLAVSGSAVSAVLVKDHEGQQHPVYYVSKSLLDAESRYSYLEKLILALIMASTKLRHYFETHKIFVKTNYPIKTVLRRPEMSGRMAKWAVKLSAFDIIYESRTAIKSQALADFVADFSSDIVEEANKEVQQLEEAGGNWILYTDGASNIRGTGLGILLKSPQGDIIPLSISCEFQATNNEAEYEALIAGLQLAKDMEIKYIQVFVDSLLLTNHFNGSYAAKSEKLIKYLEILKKLSLYFEVFSITQVPREENAEADALANLASSLKIPEGTKIPITHVFTPAIDEQLIGGISGAEGMQLDNPTDFEESWMYPIMNYIQKDEIPKDENPRTFRTKVTQYTILNNKLYRKSLAGPYLRCLGSREAQEVLKDVHEGDCGNHTGGRALFSKILRTGYYWPTMRRDAMTFSQKCDACQRHSNILHQPAEPLHSIISPWPFMKWGMDIVGKLPKAPGGKVFMLAMTDYFSKWIEAEAFVQVREKEVISFIKRNILTRFGIPAEIVCDNGSQFIGKRTTSFCESWGIKMITSTPVHPQANGQAESSNKIIINNLKKKLGAKKGKWAEELPFALWADRTTTKNATGQTPFSLVFGSEAVIPTEMVIPTARIIYQQPETNAENLLQDLDTINELRDLAKIRLAAYQQRIASSYNKNIRLRRFQQGDLVLRKAFQNTTNPADGKLAPKWEGPYLVDSEAGKGAYRLATLDGEMIPRAWNAIHLKAYFM